MWRLVKSMLYDEGKTWAWEQTSHPVSTGMIMKWVQIVRSLSHFWKKKWLKRQTSPLLRCWCSTDSFRISPRVSIHPPLSRWELFFSTDWRMISFERVADTLGLHGSSTMIGLIVATVSLEKSLVSLLLNAPHSCVLRLFLFSHSPFIFLHSFPPCPPLPCLHYWPHLCRLPPPTISKVWLSLLIRD